MVVIVLWFLLGDVVGPMYVVPFFLGSASFRASSVPCMVRPYTCVCCFIYKAGAKPISRENVRYFCIDQLLEPSQQKILLSNYGA